MAFDPNQPGIPTPNINPQPTGIMPPEPTEQQVRTMRTDLGAPASAEASAGKPAGLPSFDADEPAFTPETTTVQAPSVDQLVAQGGSKSHLWLILGGIGFVVLALVGYFIVAPMFTSTTPTPAQTPVAVTPTPVTPEPTQPAVAHKTAFINAPAATVTQVIAVSTDGSVNPVQIKGALVTQGQAGKMGLTEIVFTDSTGAPIPLGKIMVALGGDLQAAQATALNQAFTNDGTIFIYKDATGVWPGYIGEGATAQPTGLAAVTSWLEASKMLANFFVVNPGTMATFKNGTVNNLNDRYAPGTTAGASFGYLITKNKLLISTSFNGMKEALRLMGL